MLKMKTLTIILTKLIILKTVIIKTINKTDRKQLDFNR